MYILIFFILFIIAGVLIALGIRNKRRGSTAAGIILTAATVLFLWFLSFWGDKLWFESLGFVDRFWTEFAVRLAFGLTAFIIGGGFMMLFLLRVNRPGRGIKLVFSLVTAVIAAMIGAGLWEEGLMFFNSAASGTVDPVLGLDVSFYLFSLPFIVGIQRFLLTLSVMALVAGALVLTLRTETFPGRGSDEEGGAEQKPASGPFFAASAMVLFFISAGWILRRFQLLYSSGGTVSGPGWTDIYIRFPALIVAAAVGFLGILIILIPGLRKLGEAPMKKLGQGLRPAVKMVSGTAIIITAAWIVILGIVPGLIQALLVAPNEITYEKPFIERNIEFTRNAFKLSGVKEREYPMKDTAFDRSIVDSNPAIINNTRLWDWRALSSVYKQFQEIRLYYEFGDIDMDRYEINGRKRAVMIAAREMETANLTAQSRNFVNERFKYTHGYGIAMNTVNEFTDSGLPHLLVKDIPPVSESKDLEVTRPEIYFGERSDSYVIVNSSEEEFDYPQGDNNRYVRYTGDGGVEINGFFRKFLYGFKYNSTKLLFSGYPQKGSRIMMNRKILQRVRLAAPFLKFDSDPYIVLIDGELRWFVDAYTTSKYYPYSEHFTGNLDGGAIGTESLSTGINYVRNSVKAVINPYNGKVDFYIYDEQDPVIRVWQKIYPGLMKSRSEMPDKLKAHVRYPADFLLIQGEMYAKYHMTDPEVFYNQEDIWVRATEKYYSAVQPVEPYYIMWEQEGSDKPEFIIMLPYTPKNKQVLIGWIAGMSDPDHYGDFIAYKFPKEKRVLGPQQVETKIDQDSFLSGQLSLWDQRGSNVIRGNMLALPLGGTLLYVEPIYLQSETAAYPELRLVVCMHNDKLSYAETLTDALTGLFEDSGGSQGITPVSGGNSGGGVSVPLIKQAENAFNNYLEATGNGELKRAGEELQKLKDIFDSMSE